MTFGTVTDCRIARTCRRIWGAACALDRLVGLPIVAADRACDRLVDLVLDRTVYAAGRLVRRTVMLSFA